MKAETQSFAEILGDADGGRVDARISELFAELFSYLTDHAGLHSETVRGEMTLKVKIEVEPDGKVELNFGTPTVKKPSIKLPVARFYTDSNGHLTRVDQRQMEIPGTGDRGRVRDAGAPKGTRSV